MKKALFFLLFAALLSADPCKEAAERTFPPRQVREVLQSYQVPYSAREEIISKLNAEEPAIARRVRARAEKMERNPFDKPVLRIVIGRLEQEENLSAFRKILEASGFDNPRTQFEMFDQIQNKRAEILWRCRRDKYEL